MLSIMDAGSFTTMSSITHNNENYALGKEIFGFQVVEKKNEKLI